MTRRPLQSSQMHSQLTAREPCNSSSGAASGRAFAVAALVVSFGLAAPPASLASGSIGGGSGVSQFGQMYKQGKVVFFRKLACSSGCPIQRDQLDKGLAANLVESIETRDALKAETSAHDETVSLLCPGANAKGCTGVDEQELVGHYLSRRFGVGR